MLTEKFRALKGAYKKLLRLAPPWSGIILPWILSALLITYPQLTPYALVVFFISAYLLAMRREEVRIFKATLFFFLLWCLISLILEAIFPENSEFDPLRLYAFMLLGIHLFFVWTPLELSRAIYSILR
ncbi:MAG: hypothetical protein LBF22_03220, partial [Deltaproteobacteria bacterium]|nr:hypothetical protein [Deltaproteobacteria bacterium]